jgi:hypothetical protein
MLSFQNFQIKLLHYKLCNINEGKKMKIAISRLLSLVGLTSALMLTGCATNKMAFEDESVKLTATSNPVFLMTATVKNTYKNYQPRVVVAKVNKSGAKEAADRFSYMMDNASKIESDSDKSGNTYLLRFQLPPGEYEFVNMLGLASSFPIRGTFVVPIHTTFKSSTPGVFYLGHAEATVRERIGNEFKAGPSIPLLDQAISGASGGTFDVTFSDQWDAYEKTFRAKFKALEGVEVKKSILPAFNRAKAQAWWEAN